ncbi:hypothetical protein AB9P05_21150 [Roseivirga sp. BDSF3-8]|uniref:hypothetical protein n=1 Tax=Roseivirga sp. BDSF3-8 TaxID=3241598 RepID=UPI0035319477
MDIFLSWSGPKSQKIAEALKTWIPTVIQVTKPFYSSNDIAKGKRWSSEISFKLEQAGFGILIMTDENTTAPWILFEAGAISKNINTGRVCTFLFGIKETDLQGPLSQFQNTKFNKNDVFKLLKDINRELKVPLEDKVLEVTFEKMWPDLDSQISNILDSTPHEGHEEIRTERDLLEEILRHTRSIQYKHLFARSSNNFETWMGEEKSKVIFDENAKAIVFLKDNNEEYFIELGSLGKTGRILDFMFQINTKAWATSRHLKGFIDCLEELSSEYFDSNAQGVICPQGKTRNIDWKNRTYGDT